MTMTSVPWGGTFGLVHFRLRDFSETDDGVLLGRENGAAARFALEREIRGISARDPEAPLGLDFRGVRSISVPFAEGLLVPLLAGRSAGYYESHPILVFGAEDDVSETLAAALSRNSLSILGVFGAGDADLLGGEEALRETMRAVARLGQFSVGRLAEELGVSQQTANTRLNALHRIGAVARKRITPPGGGKEFVYSLPSVGDDASDDSQPPAEPLSA